MIEKVVIPGWRAIKLKVPDGSHGGGGDRQDGAGLHCHVPAPRLEHVIFYARTEEGGFNPSRGLVEGTFSVEARWPPHSVSEVAAALDILRDRGG